eukprot:TRINITY_DN2027_c0_g1_i1.p1 TRINITY_DN2027_c0_g1~~TRINITY_DN2027_c0_g1_i1.p1  ORF type:complete len:312 (+),score=46.02 TRINITY_DN2027_c0_g1_i1:74-937(+)
MITSFLSLPIMSFSDPFQSAGSIARLNGIVKRLAEAESEGKETALHGNKEALAAVKAGAIVYHQRSKAAVALYSLMAIYMLVWGTPSLTYSLCALALMMIFVDLYGAVLHVVLDHPAFIDMPIIGPGCLEFQWHHAIPHDIVSKPFIEVCGDLNLVALLHLVWVGLLYGSSGSRAAYVMCAAKIAMAYFGQWAHRQAHTPEAARPAWVSLCQNAGFMVHPTLHKQHHTTYDDGFPILNGVTAPLIALMNRYIVNKHIWLAMFAVLSLADIWVLTTVLQYALGPALSV